MYDMLVSYKTSKPFDETVHDIKVILEFCGDRKVRVEKTETRGVLGVKTSESPHELIPRIRKVAERRPTFFQTTIKWTLVDAWTSQDLEEIKTKLEELKDRIGKGEAWAMRVEKREFDMHTDEIIEYLAPVLGQEVDLDDPDKIVLLEFIDDACGIAIFTEEERFSTRE